tara:strand:+ start:50 stop:490 length:441 start_codon:yes stop_codon:yes gene_type:complete
MNKKILIVSANYYEEISNFLLQGATNYLKNLHDNDLTFTDFTFETKIAPGCFEIPFIINKYRDKFDAFIALGCIVRGETYHFELISNQVARKIMDLNISINKPIGFGILTCDNIEQARIRSDINKKNKGAEAARACIAMLIHKNYG